MDVGTGGSTSTTSTEQVFPGTFQFSARGPLVAVPSGLPFTGEDQLQITCANTVAGAQLVLSGRFQRPTDTSSIPFVQTFTPTSNGAANRFVLPLGEGTLLNLVARTPSDGVTRGRFYLRVDVLRGAQGIGEILGTLISGYVTTPAGRAWPGTPLQDPLEGPGAIIRYTAADPGFGVNPSLVMPTERRWRLMAVRGEFATSATVATRVPLLSINTGGQRVADVPQIGNQGAGAFLGYQWAPGLSIPNSSGIGAQWGPLPSDLYLNSSAGLPPEITMFTANLQAGDHWSLFAALVEEWLSPAITWT